MSRIEKSGRVLFYATLEDYRAVFSPIDDASNSQYVASYQRHAPVLLNYSGILDLPNLGTSASGGPGGGGRYLLLDRSTDLKLEEKRLYDGSLRWVIPFRRQVVLSPSALFEGHTMIAGELSFLSEEKQVEWRFRQYSDKIRKHFNKIDMYWLGPDAMRLYKGGTRFTHEVQLPSEHDLASRAKMQSTGE